MKTFIPLLLFLSATASAWKITAYDSENRECDGSNYVVHSGVGTDLSDCIELGVAGPNNDCYAFSDASGDKPAIRTECDDPNKASFTAKNFRVDDSSSCTVYYNKDRGLGGVGPNTACETSEHDEWSYSDECAMSTLRLWVKDADKYQRYFTCQDKIRS
ncbi:MAG: hypothetical protein Q9197_001761 [Variospora fuerteventurae]